MLHGYKKSRYNIYDNLEFLGLNPYELKHFCFGEGEGDAEGDAGADYDFSLANPDAVASMAAAEEASKAQAAELSQAQKDEAAMSLMSARSAEEKAAGLQDLMDMGIYGYNEAVERGFLEAIERAERDFDVRQAYEIAAKYGLDPSQVQPGFMQDPAYGPQTMSYRGPGALGAAATEIGKAAAELGVTLAEMYPSPMNMLSTIAKNELGIGLPSLGLKEGISDYFDQFAASQREANIADRGETDPDTAGIIDDFEEETAQQGAFSTSGISGVTTASDTATGFGDIDLDGNEFIPLSPAIPSTPSVAPQPAAEVVRPPVTRTAATDTFSILAGIYGPDVAEKLLPTRTV
jgi:hypothetical protein